MKNFIEWFRKQTIQKKISVVVAFGLGIVLLFSLIASFSRNVIETTKTPDGTVKVPTKEPSPEASKEPTPEKTSTPLGPPEVFSFPFGEESFNSLVATVQSAAEQECVIIENESVADRANRFAPYFTNPTEISELYELVYLRNKLTQRCVDIVFAPAGNPTDSGSMPINVSYTAFFTETSQASVAPENRTTFRKIEKRIYNMQLQADGSWKIVSVG